MSEWSHLPNSHHIDWVLKSVKQNPKLWREVSHTTLDMAQWARNVTWLAARDAARSAARNAAWLAARNAAWYAARGAALDITWNAAQNATQNAALALVAYDDCDQYLNMGYEKLMIYAVLSEKPQALLLLPMVYVREKLNERMVTFT